ncbi:MAG: sulfite oxidase [Gemmatales bacterium]|nr:sulfite oxidase [Gemmatales bacterium]MDW8387532.1 sulfite oxidase [Gemmatales bacterium]
MSGPRLDRRTFLALAGTSLAAYGSFGQERDDHRNLARIVREYRPENLESPLGTLEQPITPNPMHFVRSHFATPYVDEKTWRLRIEGAVSRPAEFELASLKRMPVVERPVTLECAGNGRVFLTPTERGLQWEHGAVGTARWAGVPLSALLERCGLKAEAVEVVLEGADVGEVRDPKSPGPIAFARSVPIQKARSDEVILAYAMNGEPLPVAHGFPLRAVVAGWYGMASIKWLKRIVVTEQSFQGFYQTFDYSFWDRTGDLPTLRPITRMQVKAVVTRPVPGQSIAAGSVAEIRGAAWAGENRVAKVEISTDGGKTWDSAELASKPERFLWTHWRYRWQTPTQSGQVKLLARTTDDAGRTQPLERNPDFRSYMIHHAIPVEVMIR